MILDHRGNPIGTTEAPIFSEVGASGYRWHSGFVDDEFHKDLRGANAQRVYEEMGSNHPIVGTALGITDLYARGAEITVEASGKTEVHERAQKLVETALDDVEGTIYGVISQAISVMQYGWCWLEKVHKICRGRNKSKVFNSKYNDGLIRWRKMAIRAQRSLYKWQIRDEDNELLGMWQMAAPSYRQRFIHRDKSIHVRLYNKNDSPEGFCPLRPAYVPYHFQKHLQKTEAIGIYRNVAGMPHFTLPAEYMAKNANANNQEYRTKVETAGKKMAMDEYASIVTMAEETPDGKKTGHSFRLISASGKNNTEADIPIQRYRTEIAAVLSIQWILLAQGAGAAGSRALSSDQTDVHSLVTAAIINCVLDAINEDAVPELLEFNGIPPEFAPRIVLGDIEKPDLAKLGPFLASGLQSGFLTPGERLEEMARGAASIPEEDPGTRPVSDIAGDMLDGTIDPITGGPPPDPLGQLDSVNPADDEYMTLAEVATRWGVSPSTVREEIRRGRLRGVRAGSRIRVSRTEVNRYMRTQPDLDLNDEPDIA